MHACRELSAARHSRIPCPGLQLHLDAQLTWGGLASRNRAHCRAGAAPPLDLSTQRPSRQQTPQTETAGGGGSRGRGWGGAPPSGGGGSGWRRSRGGDDDDGMEAGATNPFHR